MTQVINIASLVRKPAMVIVDEAGDRHEMKNATVQSFIDNLAAIEKLETGASAIQEMEVMVGMIARAFPTLNEADIRQWELDVIKTISDIAQRGGAEVNDTADTEETSDGDETAGKT